MIRGTIRGTRQGFAFLRPDDGGEDLFIARSNLSGAIDGDRVEASLHRPSARDFRPEAIVERILERPTPIHTGNVVRVSRTTFVLPDTPVLPARLRLRTGRQVVPAGAKVLFRIDNVGKDNRPVATFERLLGDADDATLDEVVVATAHHLPGRFPDEVLDEAVEAASREEAGDRARRHDYGDRLVLTIDPKTAKDFDDAISIQRDRTGYHLQVHIADASTLVCEGGALDREAARRGTSVYFPGGVVPMLPEILSSQTASLVPDQERRVLTVELDLDLEGRVVRSRFREGIIRSTARLHYEQAQRMLAEEEGDRAVRSSLRTMAELARLLRAERFRKGGFDLDLPEAEMTLDARGIPRRLWRRRTLETHRIVEEFMILANRAVGRFLTEKGVPFLFRVHGEPDPEALERFAEVALTLVPAARTRDVETLPALRRFLGQLPSGPVPRIVQFFFLRSMKKAVYATVDIGHFGLGIDRYCHFTSPIRRYPDLFNHRVLRWVLRQDPDRATGDETLARWRALAVSYASSCTRSEQTAEKAEREMVRIKLLRWAAERLGETFAGHVIGLTSAGLFVELDKVPVEGFLPREGLEPGARYQQERLAFADQRGRFELRLGDAVEVQIARVDLRERHLDLRLLRAPEAGGAGRARPARRRKGQGRRGGKRVKSSGRRRAARVKPPEVRADRMRGGKRSGKVGRGATRKRGKR